MWLTYVVVGRWTNRRRARRPIAELARRSLRDNFRHIDPATARVMSVDAAPTILPAFPESLRRRARATLEAWVWKYTGARWSLVWIGVASTPTRTTRRPLKRSSGREIWAAGVEAGCSARTHPSRPGGWCGGRPRQTRARPTRLCTLPGRLPEVFVIGNLMNLDRLPGLAQVAIQSGRHAAATIVRRLSGDPSERPLPDYAIAGRWRPYRASTPSRPSAAGQASGLFAWLLRLAMHLFALTGFKNRIAVLANWLVAFLGRGRPRRPSPRSRSSLADVEAQAAAIAAAVSLRLAKASQVTGS